MEDDDDEEDAEEEEDVHGLKSPKVAKVVSVFSLAAPCVTYPCTFMTFLSLCAIAVCV